MKQRIYHTDPNNDIYTITTKPLYIHSVGSSVLENDSSSQQIDSRDYYRLFYLYYGDISIKTKKNSSL